MLYWLFICCNFERRHDVGRQCFVTVAKAQLSDGQPVQLKHVDLILSSGVLNTVDMPCLRRDQS